MVDGSFLGPCTQVHGQGSLAIRAGKGWRGRRELAPRCSATRIRCITRTRLDRHAVTSMIRTTHTTHTTRRLTQTHVAFSFCVTVMFPNPADGLCADRVHGTVGAARRRRDRRLRAFLKHESMTVAMKLATIQHHSYLKTGVVDVGVQVGSPLAPVTEYVAPAQVPPVYSTTTVTADLVYPQFSSTAVEPYAPCVVGSLRPLEEFTEPVYDQVFKEHVAAGELTFPVVQEQVIVQEIPDVIAPLPPVDEFTGPVFDQVHQELVASSEMTENFAEIPVVHEQVIVLGIPEVFVPLPPAQEFSAPVYGQVHQVFVGMRPERLVDARGPQRCGRTVPSVSPSLRGTVAPWLRRGRRQVPPPAGS